MSRIRAALPIAATLILTFLATAAVATPHPAHAAPPAAPHAPIAAAPASPAATATPPPAPPVDVLVAQALAASPAVAARAAAVAAQREREQAAGARPDPMVEARLQNVGLGWSVGDEEMSMLEAEVRQPILGKGKRAAAGAVAAAERGESEVMLAVERRDIALAVRTLYAGVYALDREHEALLAARELVELFTETARSRYATGGGEQEGVIKAGLQRLRIEERLADLDSERQAQVSALDRWLDRAGDAPLGSVAALPAIPALDAQLEQRAVAAAPAVLTAEAAARTAERRVEAARAALRPDWSVAAGAGYRGSLDPVITLGVGVELPLWKRQKQLPLLRAAEQDLESARRSLDDARATARADVAAQLAALRNADEQARRYRDGILPQADAALDAARAAYLAGRGDFSTMGEDFQLWLDARAGLARREAARYTAWATLAHRAGLEPLADAPPAPAAAPTPDPSITAPPAAIASPSPAAGGPS